MVLLQKPPVSACAWAARRVLGCLAISLLLATLANAEIIGYDSWQWNGFSRTLLPPSPNSSPISILSSILLNSWSSDNIVSESAVASTLTTSGLDASLSGVVYFDANFDGIRDSGDWAIRDAIVSLTSPSTDTVLIATTDANGAYSFKNLNANDYTLTLLTPSAAPEASTNMVGILTDQDGTPIFTGLGVVTGGNTSITGIQLKTGYTGAAYDFPQLTYPTNLTSKRMLLNNDPGTPNTPDAPLPPLPPVPEPGTLALLAIAGLCVGGFARRRS
jgi:hypothetical protein